MERFELSPFVHRPQQKRSRIALARIIAGASEVLIREDLDTVSMADIAKAAGVPLSSIYRRFKGKDSIIQAISADTFRRLEDIVRDRMQGHDFASAGEVVAELARGIAEMCEQNEALVRLMIVQSSVTDATHRNNVIAARRRLVGYYREAISGFLQHLSEQRRDIVVGFSYHIVAAAFVNKARGDFPIVIELSWSDLTQEVIKAATGHLLEAV